MPLTLCPLGNFSCFLSFADILENQVFRKILSGIASECQTNWIQIRPYVLSGLIWVQSVCKGYEQSTLVGNELKEKSLRLETGPLELCKKLLLYVLLTILFLLCCLLGYFQNIIGKIWSIFAF